MRHQVRLEFSSFEGATQLSRRRFGWPFFVGRQMRTAQAPHASAVIIQSASGTLNAGDQTHASFAVGQGAHALVRAQGAPSVHCSRDGGKASEAMEIEVGAQGMADVVSEPRVLFPGSRYEQLTDINVQPGGRVLLSEGIVALRGHSGAMFTSFESRLRIRRAGTLLVDDIVHTSRWDASPGNVSSFLAVGQVMVIADECDPSVIDRSWSNADRLVASTLLPNGAGTLVRIAALNGLHLRNALQEVARAMRGSLAI